MDREVRRALTMVTGGMLPLAKHLCGSKADDRMQSTQLWLDATHLGSKTSTQVIQIKGNLISKYFQCLLCATRQLWLEWMTLKTYSITQIPLFSVPDAWYYINWIFIFWTEHLLVYVDVQTKPKVMNYFSSTSLALVKLPRWRLKIVYPKPPTISKTAIPLAVSWAIRIQGS